MIKPQEEVDWKKPEEHFAWALRNMPTFAGIGAVTHPGFLKTWSKHLWDCGFAHRDYLESLADEDGNIHVSKLPKQRIRWQAPFRGARSNYNNAARWVSMDTPAPKPMKLPDVRQLTQQENEFMLRQYRELGLINDYIPQRDTAQELN
ncbi:hypothetical protein ROCKSTAR_28 [Mycobacterium phage Rockstar]|nr:minor tail protein [Mycobacterium phage BTCU-1]YP_009614545.1 minor tail protein [Mycobacterium phage Rockstar]QJD52004.1 hypothetical protein PBI_MK4_28 [Mycobacterium phage MK4]QJD52164.1 hypothetical protein PBI_JF4_28 [Mycobacterium phage JF4]QJD52243.1 hypothetical protein PBI_JF2_28 [Mycobacterium phage JF2]BBC53747.1 putative minor tail protein [Mycobacterium phage B1]AEK07394.1 hypothetical protein ROCKSTAR_28 [Mycobacterium phage Rockstar]